MRYLKSLKDLLTNRFCVKYKVTNYNMNSDNTPLSEDPLSGLPIYKNEWDSEEYSYVVSAKNEKNAEDVFKKMWWENVGGFEPTPKLTIISVEQTKNGLSKGDIKLY